MPNEKDYAIFESIPKLLYKTNSQRFTLGHEPVNTHLEGCYVLLKNTIPVGRFAFYENPNLTYHNQPASCIGSYECLDDLDCSNYLLSHAKNLAKKKNYNWLIGPMDGSTWNGYRFSSHHETKNFFMEPYHHLYYTKQFTNVGFEVISKYVSNLATDLAFDPELLKKSAEEYRSQGAVIRNLRMDDFDNEMRKLAQCSIDWFENNFLYTPISVDEFVCKYTKLKPIFDPRLVWIIENKNGEINAFLFAIKDYWDPSNQTLIIKSLARKHNSPFKKIGAFLSGLLNQTATQLGYTKVIHAMMISENASLDISNKRSATSHKSYQLYGMKL